MLLEKSVKSRALGDCLEYFPKTEERNWEDSLIYIWEATKTMYITSALIILRSLILIFHLCFHDAFRV